MKKIKSMLLKNGYTLEKELYVGVGDVKISNEYYKKGDKCVKFSKIGKSRVIVTLFTEWERKFNYAGEIYDYDVSDKDIEKFIRKNK